MRIASLLVVLFMVAGCYDRAADTEAKVRFDGYGVVTATNSSFTFTWNDNRFYANDVKGKTEDGRDIEIRRVWMNKKVDIKPGFKFRLTSNRNEPELVIIDAVIRE